jgi:hypothetical protein
MGYQRCLRPSRSEHIFHRLISVRLSPLVVRLLHDFSQEKRKRFFIAQHVSFLSLLCETGFFRVFVLRKNNRERAMCIAPFGDVH